MEQTYRVKVTCNNCGGREMVNIPIGESLEDWLKKGNNNICSYCGCDKKNTVGIIKRRGKIYN